MAEEKMYNSGVVITAANSLCEDSKKSSFIDKINQTAEEANDMLNNLSTDINGVLKRGLDAISGGLPSVFSGMEGVGIFENILCGTLSNLNIRMPQYKLNLLRNLNFDFNSIICGKSKQANPFDAIIQLIDNVNNARNLLSGSNLDIFNALLDTQIGSLLKSIGLNSSIASACLLSDVKSSSSYFSLPYGANLKSKLSLSNLLGDGCAGLMARSFLNAQGVRNDIIASSSFVNFLNHLSSMDRGLTTTTLSNYWNDNKTKESVKVAIYNGLANTTNGSKNTNAVYNKVYAVSNILANNKYNPATGRVEVPVTGKVNGLDVYGNVYSYRGNNDESLVIKASGVYEEDYPVYGFGPNGEPIIGFTTDGDPIYEYTYINGKKVPVIGYIVIPIVKTDMIDEDTGTGEINLSKKFILGYTDDGEPVINIKDNGDGVTGYDIYGGELITPANSLILPTAASADSYKDLLNKPIAYSTDNRPIYDFDSSGLAVSEILKERVNLSPEEIAKIKNNPIGYTKSGKPIYGYTADGYPIVDYVIENGIAYAIVYKTEANVKTVTPYGTEPYDSTKVSHRDIVDMRNEADSVIRGLDDTDLNELYKNNEDPNAISNSIMTTLSMLDKDWNKDELGNNSMHKFADNKTMSELAKDALYSKTLTNNDFLSGIYSTNLNLNEQILVVNATYEKDRTLY